MEEIMSYFESGLFNKAELDDTLKRALSNWIKSVILMEETRLLAMKLSIRHRGAVAADLASLILEEEYLLNKAWGEAMLKVLE